MYIVRWLMTHPIIAIWVLGAIAIVLSKSASFQGTHEIENAEVTHQIEETHNDNEHKIDAATVTDKVSVVETNSNEVVSINHEAASAPEEELATQTVEDEDSVKSREEEAASATATKSATAKNATNDSTVTESTTTKKIASVMKDVKDTTINTAKQAAESIVNKSESVVSAMTATTKSSTDTIKEAIVQKVREAQPTGTVTTTAQNQSENIQNPTSKNDGSYLAQTSSANELLIMAREAYWNNGFDEATELYIQLIKLEPNVMDHKGELGNVYWRQGYPKKAAELYSEIALPMIENGNSDRVANMVGFIGLFYPDRATTIHQKLMSKISGAE